MLNSLARSCAEDLNPTEADELLNRYWTATFPEEWSNPEWQKIGFQGRDARTDLRTGVFALRNMVYMAETYPEDFKRIVSEAQTLEYPLSASMVNVSMLLALLLGVAKDGSVSPVKPAVEASLAERRHFVAWRFSSLGAAREAPDAVDRAFNELFCATVFRLHNDWRQRKEKGATLLEFGESLKTAIMSARHALRSKAPLPVLAELSDRPMPLDRV